MILPHVIQSIPRRCLPRRAFADASPHLLPDALTQPGFLTALKTLLNDQLSGVTVPEGTIGGDCASRFGGNALRYRVIAS